MESCAEREATWGGCKRLRGREEGKAVRGNIKGEPGAILGRKLPIGDVFGAFRDTICLRAIDRRIFDHLNNYPETLKSQSNDTSIFKSIRYDPLA